MAWNNVLCLYYSRTGNTRKAMEEIAKELGAELVELRDGVDRSGWGGWLRCGVDAMRRTTRPVKIQTRIPLSDYQLVIIGSPVWAGRCSSVVRGFLKEHGKELRNASYVLTRGTEDRNEEVFIQMDRCTPCGHQTAASLRLNSVGYTFWLEEFLRETKEFLRKR